MAKKLSKKDYEVGYCKPPKHVRFKKGRSGNPKGRPKGSKNFDTDLKEELNERIQVTEGGKTKRITKQRAVIKSTVNTAIKGREGAAKTIFSWLTQELENSDAAEAEPPLVEDEEKLLDLLTERARRRQLAKAGKDEDDNESSGIKEGKGQPGPENDRSEDDDDSWLD